MCILQSHKDVNIWGLPLRFKLSHSYVACWLKQVPFSFWSSFGSCLCEFAWCGFSLICFSYILWETILFHLILTMALLVGSNSWNYQQTFFQNMAFKFLPLAICFLLWSWSWSSFLYTTEKYLNMLLVHDKWYS